MTFTSKQRFGFRASRLHKRKQPHAFQYLKERMTFWIAVLSLFAFVTGNMMGKLGWYGFWASVLGEFDDSLLTYTGTVPPIRKVPDYRKWSLYGGDAGAHLYREVPQDLLVDLPSYIAPDKRGSAEDQLFSLVYSVDYLGTYKTGRGEGSHAGIDVRVPEGTPVYAMMDGIVLKSADDGAGFGTYVQMLHRAPDPGDPSKLIRMYSLYAHLSSSIVEKGTVVRKGEQIGASGMSGNASGPHLHVQMGRDPTYLWPYTNAELREAGLTFSQGIDQGFHRAQALQSLINPMFYAQMNYAAPTVIAKANESLSSSAASRRRVATRQDRLQARLARAKTEPAVSVAIGQEAGMDRKLASIADPAVTVTSAPVPPAVPVPASRTASRAEFEMASSFSDGRKWYPVTIRLYDAEGRPVVDPESGSDFHLSTAYGKAEFRPAVLSSLDFRSDGSADVDVLPLGKQTVVLQMGLNFQSEPMRYIGTR